LLEVFQKFEFINDMKFDPYSWELISWCKKHSIRDAEGCPIQKISLNTNTYIQLKSVRSQQAQVKSFLYDVRRVKQRDTSPK